MRDFRTISFWQRLRRASLGADSSIDSGLYASWERSKAAYERFYTFMDRFHVTGIKKFGVNLACEALTFGVAGVFALLVLAGPAFKAADDPNWLKRQDLAVTFLDRYGQEIGRRGIRRDDSVVLEDFPDHLLRAVLATEDRRFYEHFGIDVIGTARALSANAKAGGTVQGGSSITQQLAKNLFLTNERSLERKIKEAFLALWLEHHLTKREILQLYLDRAYMGAGNFGIQAAAEFYFNKNIKDVSLAEAAMLAGLFKAPSKYAPHVNLPAARARANDVLSNLVDAGFMTDAQVFGARQNPATAVERKRDSSPDYYCDWAFEDIKRLVAAGRLGDQRVLVVKTSFDGAIQLKSDTTIEGILRQSGPEYDVTQAAAVIMDPDGAVRAITGGRDYGASQFNRAVDGQRQPGSSFKPFVYAAALLTGKFKPTTVVTDRPSCVGNWCPQNYNRSHVGSLPLTSALARSINTIPIQLATAIGDGNNKVGRGRIVALARKLGLTTPLVDQVSLPIGSAEVTVMDMAAGYSVFANGGKRAEPYAAVEVRNARGEVIYRHDQDAPHAEQILPPGVTADLNFMLSKVVEEGTGKRAALEGIRVAGKTGTTNDYRDAWFIGFTGNLVGAIWYGNDDSSSTDTLTGGILPAMTWHEIMEFAHRDVDLKPIPGVAPLPKPGEVVAGKPVPQKAPAANTIPGFEPVALAKPQTLSRRTNQALSTIEDAFREQSAKRITGKPVSVTDGRYAAPTIGARTDIR